MLGEEVWDTPALREMLEGSSVLVTGGTGSFGRTFLRILLDFGLDEESQHDRENLDISKSGPRRIVVFSRDELKQSELMAQLSTHRNAAKMRYFIGDVRDAERLEQAFDGVDYIFHAAALKQVPIIEYNPFEAIRTNVLGAQNIITAAIKCGVKKVVALSTDKACTPVNLYGASKLASDKLFISGNAMVGAGNTSFCVVRYGNVFGSRGSIVPVFLEKLRRGIDSLPVTDNSMTRFTISLAQAVNLVLEALEFSHGGELFVPRIPSYRVPVLIDALAGADFPRHVVGIRPGEKLHEMMIPADEAHNTRMYDNYYVVFPAITFDNLSKAHGSRSHAMYKFMKQGKEVPPGFQYASDTNSDWVTAGELHAQARAAYKKLFHEEYPANGFKPRAAADAEGSVNISLDEAEELARDESVTPAPTLPHRSVVGARPMTSEADVDAVAAVLRSSMLTTGPQVEKFEAALCEATHAARAVVVSNGTAALHVAYAALEAGRSGDHGIDTSKTISPFEWSSTDAIIVPAITFSATANAAKYVGAVPVFADVNPATLLIDVADAAKKCKVAQAAGLTVRAIVCVDMCGQPCELRELRALADEVGCALVIDGAHSLGAKYDGSSVMKFCDLMTTSFHPVKTITSGEGGAVFSNSQELADRAKQFRQHGMMQSHSERDSAGGIVSDQAIMGYNYRLSDIHCALGISQLSRSAEFLEGRQRVASWYATELKEVGSIRGGKIKIEAMETASHTKEHAYHLFVVRLSGVGDAVPGGRNAVFKEMKARGVGVNLHYIPVYQHSYYRKHEGDTPAHHLAFDSCPAADATSAEMMSLPMWAGLEREDVRYTIATLVSVLETL